MQLHSFWNSITEPILHALHPRCIVEIGTGTGKGTEQLLQYCKENACTLHTIDSKPQCDCSELQEEFDDILTVHREYSLNVLPLLHQYDVVLIDGDHNWYTVYHELLIIERSIKENPKRLFPLIILHDIGWPYGRRDLYYDLETIPIAYRQAHVTKGLMLHQGTPVDHGGFNEGLTHAIYENTPKNGVRTAVEDFLAQTELSLTFSTIPGNHGLGILALKEHMEAKNPLGSLLRSFHVSEPLIAHITTIEHECIRGELARNEQSNTLTALQQQHAQANQENARLMKEQAQTHEENARLMKEHAQAHQEKERLMKERAQAHQEKERLMKERAQAHQEKERLMKSLKEERETAKRNQRQLQEARKKVEAKLEKVFLTKSWRWTASLRKWHNRIRRFTYAILHKLRCIWVWIGQPCPELLRHIRHQWLGRLLPAQEMVHSFDPTICSDRDLTTESHTNNPSKQEGVPWRRITFQPKASTTRKATVFLQGIDIIIPTHNNAEHTIKCIESIKMYTSDYRIIWIDNGSTSEQISLVENSLKEVPHIALKHPKRLGYIKATNMGIAASSSEIVILLNNDTEVTKGWLEALLAPFDTDPTIGIAGPITDAKGSWQGNVESGTGYRVLSGMVAFFCVAIHREVIRQIGYLSEEFGEGFADDDDYCTQAMKTGWKVVLAKEAFVRHAHRTTFRSVHGHEKVDMMVKEALVLFKSKHSS